MVQLVIVVSELEAPLKNAAADRRHELDVLPEMVLLVMVTVPLLL